MWRQSSNHEFAFWDAKLNAPAMTTCKEIKQIKGIIKVKRMGQTISNYNIIFLT